MEEIEVYFTPDILEDITKEEVSKVTIDFIINYEDDIIGLDELKVMKDIFIQDEFYYYAEAVKRALKAVKVIF